jgi:hypothetical protein
MRISPAQKAGLKKCENIIHTVTVFRYITIAFWPDSFLVSTNKAVTVVRTTVRI